MSDQPFYASGYKAPARTPWPGEPLWFFQKGGIEWSAELRFHGGGVGWEPQIFK